MSVRGHNNEQQCAFSPLAGDSRQEVVSGTCHSDPSWAEDHRQENGPRLALMAESGVEEDPGAAGVIDNGVYESSLVAP